MTAIVLLSLSASLAQESSAPDVLVKYGLKPNIEFNAVEGKVSFAKDEVVELVGATDLSIASAKPWDYRGNPLASTDAAAFWKILDLRDETLKSIQEDPDKRSFALAFRIPKKQITCKDIESDEREKYDLFLTKTVPASNTKPYIGLARVLKPKGETDLFNFRLESLGGTWKKVTNFGYKLETTIDGMEFVMRQYPVSEFVEVGDEKTTVEFVSYYFTIKLPGELHALDLRVTSNDSAAELKALPVKEPIQHIPGEVRGDRFKGYDLFIVYAPKKKEFDRVFTLQARPKRIAVFKDIPIKPTS